MFQFSEAETTGTGASDSRDGATHPASLPHDDAFVVPLPIDASFVPRELRFRRVGTDRPGPARYIGQVDAATVVAFELVPLASGGHVRVELAAGSGHDASLLVREAANAARFFLQRRHVASVKGEGRGIPLVLVVDASTACASTSTNLLAASARD